MLANRPGRNSEEDRRQAIQEEAVKREAQAANRRLELEFARRARIADEEAARAEHQRQEEENLEEQPRAGTSQEGQVPRSPLDQDAEQGDNEQIQATMVAFDTQNEADAPEAVTKAATIKLEYNQKEIEFWFNQLEAVMKFRGVKHQWTVLITLLPANACSEVKHLLKVREETAGNDCYKKVKNELIRMFGMQEEDKYEFTSGLILTTTPSQLCRRIIDIVCPDHPTLEGCCSAPIIQGMWKAQLPKAVKNALAEKIHHRRQPKLRARTSRCRVQSKRK